MNQQEIYRKAIELVRDARGKLEVRNKVGAANLEELSIAYTPGVAAPTMAVHKDKELQFSYTSRQTMLAIVTDGTAVLGLGDIGPEAAMVVMEGKGVMLRHFAQVDPVPICLSTKDPKRIIDVVKAIEPSFGFIFLEDIAAPNCFEIEGRLNQELSVPVFHDDQHGTAIAINAALSNAMRLTGDKLIDKRIVINGAGASAMGTYHLLRLHGAQDIVMCDSKGVLRIDRDDLNPYKAAVAAESSPDGARTLDDAMRGADVFIGLSRAGLVSPEMVRSMHADPIVFGLANPDPEIMPPAAKAAGARFVGSGRFDYPNAVNNLLAFPGIVRGAVNVRARHITPGMKLAAVQAIAGFVTDEQLNDDYLLPNPLNPALATTVAKAVGKAAMRDGVNRA